MYCSRWPKRRKWPKVYFKWMGAAQDHETWRVYYLQRHLQDAINVNGCKGNEDCSLPAGTEYKKMFKTFFFHQHYKYSVHQTFEPHVCTCTV